jgi:hypothetical protein
VPLLWVASVHGRYREGGQGGGSYPGQPNRWNPNYGRWDKNRPVAHPLRSIEAGSSGSAFNQEDQASLPFLNKVTMKTTGLLNAFFLVSVRRIVRDLLAVSRFTEADACALLSAYGLHALEIDRLQNNRLNEQKETGGTLGAVRHRKPIGEPLGPIPLCIHPDFIRAHRTPDSPKPIHRYEPLPLQTCATQPTTT